MITTGSSAEAEVTGTEQCETCGNTNSDGDLYGYHVDGAWHWYCSAHRPGRQAITGTRQRQRQA
jgi:hypothetical protein